MRPHDHDPSDEDLILYHYGESPNAAAIVARLDASAEARRRYAELQSLLAAADAWAPPELPASFADDVWRRLQPRLGDARASADLADPAAVAAAPAAAAAAPAPKPVAVLAASVGAAPGAAAVAPDAAHVAASTTPASAPVSATSATSVTSVTSPTAPTPPPRSSVVSAAHRFGARTRRWLPAAAAATLLLAVGYLAGRLATDPTPAQPQALSAEARQRLLVETLAEHLERSQRLFTELANGAPEETAELASEQLAARELLSANRLYRTAAEHGGRDGVAALLDEMEPVLLELAHLPAEPQPADLEFLRRRIEAQGLLFKTRVASELLTRSLRPDAAPLSRSTV